MVYTCAILNIVNLANLLELVQVSLTIAGCLNHTQRHIHALLQKKKNHRKRPIGYAKGVLSTTQMQKEKYKLHAFS